jgi:hypothetical protein
MTVGILVLVVLLHRPLLVWGRDLAYGYRYWVKDRERWKPLVDANVVTPWARPPLRLQFITLDTRGDDDLYVHQHNLNLQAYVTARNAVSPDAQYGYTFFRECPAHTFAHRHQSYWCKFFALREYLERPPVDAPPPDYVVWMDSDTIITDLSRDLLDILRKYSSHWFVGLDKPNRYDLVNAGVVIVRNSPQGRQMLRELTERWNGDWFQYFCAKTNGGLRGVWAATCYEQGVMNDLLQDPRYRDYCTVLPSSVVHNSGGQCSGEFITHLYQSTARTRERCFTPYTTSPLPHPSPEPTTTLSHYGIAS